MKWNRKKSSSLIDRVFPISWFSKFKQKRGDRESDSAQLSKNNLLDLPSPTAPRYRGGRFYSMDEDDAFWRISFGEDRVPPRRSCGGVNHDIGNSNFRNLRLGEGEVSRKGEFRNFSEMVSDVKKMREKERVKHVRESIHILPMETKMKSESHLKKRRENSKGCNCNFKAYSPRTELKIRALEEKKRSRARKERVDSVFDDSFAVVKSSLDPERDFKESMVEMIREKGICNPYDLEQLLACYLTLNSDEYHDLIITVFRQVWIEQKN